MKLCLRCTCIEQATTPVTSKKKSKFSSKLTFRAKQNLVNNETDQADNNLLACKLSLTSYVKLLLCHSVFSSRPPYTRKAR